MEAWTYQKLEIKKHMFVLNPWKVITGMLFYFDLNKLLIFYFRYGHPAESAESISASTNIFWW